MDLGDRVYERYLRSQRRVVVQVLDNDWTRVGRVVQIWKDNKPCPIGVQWYRTRPIIFYERDELIVVREKHHVMES